jgi:hypothetical protein
VKSAISVCLSVCQTRRGVSMLPTIVGGVSFLPHIAENDASCSFNLRMYLQE